MGMYTEIVLGVTLKSYTPPAVIDLLRRAVDGKDEDGGVAGGRVLRPSGSAYFHSRPEISFVQDDEGSCWSLNVRNNIKDYSGDIKAFCQWIAPFVISDEMAGYCRTEDCPPTLIVFDDGKVKWIEVRCSPDVWSDA